MKTEFEFETDIRNNEYYADNRQVNNWLRWNKIDGKIDYDLFYKNIDNIYFKADKSKMKGNFYPIHVVLGTKEGYEKLQVLDELSNII